MLALQKRKIAKGFGLISTLFSLSMTSTAYAGLAMNDLPGRNQTWMVACQKLPMHASATGYSKTVGFLNYKDHVKIKKLSVKYELPPSQQKQAPENDDPTAINFEPSLYAWAQVNGPSGKKGFVPVSCLVNGRLANGKYEDPSDIAKQTVSLSAETIKQTVSSRGFSRKEKGDRVAMRGMSPTDPIADCSAEMIESNAKATVSSRGFSRKEKGDRVAMRGMSSSGSDGICIKEDYQGLEDYIKKVPFVTDSYNEDLAFRQEGGLGEFK